MRLDCESPRDAHRLAAAQREAQVLGMERGPGETIGVDEAARRRPGDVESLELLRRDCDTRADLQAAEREPGPIDDE